MSTHIATPGIAGPVESVRGGIAAGVRRVPIRVFGFDTGRVEFSEDTFTLAVGQHSARIALRNLVIMDDVVRIVNLEDYQEADFRIVGPTRLATSGVSELVVQCLDKKRNIWGLPFAETPYDQLEAEGPWLECRACGKQQRWPASEAIDQVLLTFGIVVYDCAACAQPTYWSHADTHLRPAGFPPIKDVAPPPRAYKTQGIINTRKHKRLPLKMPVLVRVDAAHEELSTTENISVGGFAAVLGLELELGQKVTYMCPYLVGGQNIGRQAECRWAAGVTPGGGRKIYGFRYVQ